MAALFAVAPSAGAQTPQPDNPVQYLEIGSGLDAPRSGSLCRTNQTMVEGQEIIGESTLGEVTAPTPAWVTEVGYYQIRDAAGALQDVDHVWVDVNDNPNIRHDDPTRDEPIPREEAIPRELAAQPGSYTERTEALFSRARWLTHGLRDDARTDAVCALPKITGTAREPMRTPNVFVYRYSVEIPAGAIDLRLDDFWMAFDNEIDIVLNGTELGLLNPSRDCPDLGIRHEFSNGDVIEPALDGLFHGLDCDRSAYMRFRLVDGDAASAALRPGVNEFTFTIRDYRGVQGLIFFGNVAYRPPPTNIPVPAGEIVKSSETELVSEVGQVVEYRYEVTNTGEVAFAPLVADDNVDGEVTCPDVELGPGESAICTATRIITADDLLRPEVADGVSCSLHVIRNDGTNATFGYRPPDNIDRSIWLDGQEYPLNRAEPIVAPVSDDGLVGYPSRLLLRPIDDYAKCVTQLENTAELFAVGAPEVALDEDSWSIPVLTAGG